MGAAISLRWASEDHRIGGVLAQSPFRNGLDATTKFRPNDGRVKFASGLFVHGGYKRMLEQVDIPAAVAKRDDLLIWLSCGDHDYFPESDQRAILDASASPQWMKRFVLIPNCEHGGQWRWSENDALIRAFLEAGAPPPRRLLAPLSPSSASPALSLAALPNRSPRAMNWIVAASMLAAAVLVVLRLRRRMTSLAATPSRK
jgi:hypothetical protein